MKELLVFLLPLFFFSATNGDNFLVTKGELFTIQNSLIDRMVDSNIDPYMKFVVFYNMREMSYNNNLGFLMNIVDIMTNNQSYIDPVEAVGGEKGAKAVKRLADAYIEIENKVGMIQFMELCVELMKSPNVPKEMWQNFLYKAVEIWNEKGHQPMSKVKEELMSGQFEVPEKLLNALGIYYKLTISDEAIANITQFWKSTPGLNDGRIIGKLDSMKDENASMILVVPMLQAFNNSDRLTHEAFFNLRLAFKKNPDFDVLMTDVLDPILNFFDLNFSNIIIEYLFLSPDLKAMFMEKLNGNEGIKKFFEEVQLPMIFTAEISPFYKNITFDLSKVSKLISLWKTLDDPMRLLLEELMTRTARFEDCKKLYEDQNVSEQAKKVVEMTRLLKTGGRFGSCTGNVIPLTEIDGLDWYFWLFKPDEYFDLYAPTEFPNRVHEFAVILDEFNPRRKPYRPNFRSLDKIADVYKEKYNNESKTAINRFIMEMWSIVDLDFFAFAKTIEQVLALNWREREEFLEKLSPEKSKTFFERTINLKNSTATYEKLYDEVKTLELYLKNYNSTEIIDFAVFIYHWSFLPEHDRMLVEKVFYNEMGGKTCSELISESTSTEEQIKELKLALALLKETKTMDCQAPQKISVN
uniref:WSN domain-containing protein n=1 Tax=Caenorhabditis tropicalis TaxID=1561998 RepID=A0A1I7TTW8_9PELO